MPVVIRAIARIETSRCSGCGRCISACDLRLFAFETRHWKKRAVLSDPSSCTGCGQCEARCSTAAISMVALETQDAAAPVHRR